MDFYRSDGTFQQVWLKPAHDDGRVEFQAGRRRYRVSRQWFLRVIGPLGLPESRFYRFPDTEPSIPENARDATDFD